MNRLFIAGLVGGVTLLLPLLAEAQQYSVGDQVVVIRDADIRVESEKVDSAFPGLVLKVTAVNGDYLWVNNRHPGWLETSHVVPLDRRAIDRLTEMIRANPNSAGLFMGRAVVWMSLGELDIALADSNEAIRLNPSSAAAYGNRGNAWRAKGEYDRAIADYNQAIDIDKTIKEAYYNRGIVWHDKRDYEKAIVDLNEALRIDPKYAYAYNARSMAWELKGQYDKAIADCNEALRIDPKYAEAYNGLAWLRATCPDATYRDGTKAVADATRACELSAWKEPNYLDTLAAAYAASGDFAKAVEMEKKAIELATESDKAVFVSRLQLYESGQPYREEKK